MPLTDPLEILEHDPECERYRVAYDATATPPSVAVVWALESLDDDFDHVRPLYEAVDPNALDRVLRSADRDRTDGLSVRFTYCGFRVTVTDRGVLEVRAESDETREGST